MLLDRRFILYIFLDTPTAWLACYLDGVDFSEYGSMYSAFQMEVKSACEMGVTCDDQPCGPGSSCSQLELGYFCRCAPGYGGINCTDDSRIDQVYLVENQTTIVNSPGYLIEHNEQHVWRVSGKPGCGIGIMALDFELLNGKLELRSSPSEYDVITSFEGSPRPYAYVDDSEVWLEFWLRNYADYSPRGFSLELSIQCIDMSYDTCYESNPCGPWSECSVLERGYYCLCDAWYTGINCLEERRPLVVMAPDSTDEMAVLSPGLNYPSATDFLWRIDADVGCSIGAYFMEMRILDYVDVLTVLPAPPSLRQVFYQFHQNGLAYFFVESSHVWLEFKSGLDERHVGVNTQVVMHIRCERDIEMTRCGNRGPCNKGSACTDSEFGYVCTCPPGYTGLNCNSDTYVTHLDLSKDEDRHLQYFLTDMRNSTQNIWHVQGAPRCAIGVSTNHYDIGVLNSLRFLSGFDIDTTFAFSDSHFLDTMYMYITSSELVIQIDFQLFPANLAHFELEMETQCTEAVLSCDDSPCSVGSSCHDQDYGFVCRCFPGYTGTNCSVGNNVHRIDLEMDHPMVLDLPNYLGYPPPYPQMSWYIQGRENYAIGMNFQMSSNLYIPQLTMSAERAQLGFITESSSSVFVLVERASMWLSCPEHTCTFYGTFVHEISIQPSQDLSPDPCEKADCLSSECSSLDIGYICYCLPGFHGVQCRNDSGVQRVFVNSSEIVAIPFPFPPMSSQGRAMTHIQTIPGCGIGVVRTTVHYGPVITLTFRVDIRGDALLTVDLHAKYDQYLFFDHPTIWMETSGNVDDRSNFIVNVTSQCNEGKMASCSQDSCGHGSLCTSLQSEGYTCQCQVGFAGIRCAEEIAVGHLEVNASVPGTILFIPEYYSHAYQAWRVVVAEGCGIGIDFRHLELDSYDRFTIKDELTVPSINQLYTDTLMKDLYIHFPQHTLWFQYEYTLAHLPLHIVVYESCVTGNCSLGLCSSESVCKDFYDGYRCDCLPGFGGVNCAQDIDVRKWILNPSQELATEILKANMTCRVEVPDTGCGIEFFLNHSDVIVVGPKYLSLVIQSSVAKSTFLTTSPGKFNEYAYFNLSIIWFQLYLPLEFAVKAQVRMSARCDSSLLGVDCASSPCSVHSDCFDHGAGYKCVCHPGYIGVNCSEVMDEAKGLVEYIQANNTNMNITICRELHMCSFMGCGRQIEDGSTSSGCSCDDMCEHFGDCCWDYQSACQNGGGGVGVGIGGLGFGGFGFGGFGLSGAFDPTGTEEEEFDMPASIHPTMFSCASTFGWNYLFVSRCPSEWKISDSQARCEGAADFNDPLTFVPVSLGTKVTFQNVYCAVCHGVHPANLTSWSVGFDCGADVQPSNLDEMLDRMRRGICNHTIYDSGELSRTPACRPCFVGMINQCPEDYADDAIAEACAGFRAPLKPYRTQSTFSNGYCLECNLPGYSYSEFIPCVTQRHALDRPPAGFPLTVLVDFKGNDGIQVKVNQEVVRRQTVECQEGAVFDSLARICRSLSCTDGFTLQDGECVLNVRCDGNHVGIELNGLNVTNRECVSSQEMQHMMKCLADILELSLKDVSLVHANPDVDDCISYNVNETITLDVHIKMSFSEMRKLIANTSGDHLCGASMLQFYVSCSDENSPCHRGWVNINYGNEVSVASIDQISHLTFKGVQATQRYQPAEVRKTITFQRQQQNSNISVLENVQFCTDLSENFTIPRSGDLLCPTITMNASEFHQVQVGNNTVMVHLKSGRQFNESEFEMSDTGNVLVCSFLSAGSGIVNVTVSYEFLQYSEVQSILSTVCVSLSLICLSVTLVTHIIFPSLRKLTNNKLLMMLCVFLLLAQLLTVVGSYASPVPALCKFISVTTHFCWIAVFALTNSLAFDLHHTFGYNRSFSFAQTSFKSLIRYLVYVPGISLCVVIPCVCIDSITDSTVLDYTYGDLCWVGDDFSRFMSFGVPMAVLLAINAVLFLYTALGIWKGHQNAKKVGRKTRSNVQERFDLLKIYIKVSTLMGFTWTTAFIIPFSGIPALWYLFIVLNGLQGVYLFLAFTANVRVWNLCKALVYDVEKSSSSSGKSTKFTENSIRSEMNSQSVDHGKVVDDLTVDLTTVRQWKEEKGESLKQLDENGMKKN